MGDAWAMFTALQRHLMDQRQPCHAQPCSTQVLLTVITKSIYPAASPVSPAFHFPFLSFRCDSFNTHQ